MVGRKILDEKYPDSDYPNLTEAEDPEMVRSPLLADAGQWMED
jgi:hypothetical protein